MDEMKVIATHEYTLESGIHVKMTVSTKNGEPVSPEDQAFLRRILPLGAGMTLDAVAPEVPDAD